MKRAGGRRFYRPQDLVVLRGVRRLLHDEGYTIKGVQKLHREQGLKRLVEAGEHAEPMSQDRPPSLFGEAHPALDPGERARLVMALDELTSAKARLDGLLQPR